MNKSFSILIIDDDKQQRDMLSSFLANHGFKVFSAQNGQSGLAELDSRQIDLIVSDVRMPGMDGLEFLKTIRVQEKSLPLLFITAFPDIRDAVSAMRDGAVNYLEKPIDLNEMLDSIHHSLKMQVAESELELDMPALPEEVIIKSRKMIDLIKDVSLIAPSDVGVLICGDSGTGKEVIADLIHQWSERAAAPFLKINCAAIPENLLESELFGFEKGAFTGASSKRAGLFEQADGGTILLDEISEMPLFLQAKLLRVTQDGSFIPLGSSQQKKFNVRIIAATNKNLAEEVAKQNFREDLFYRLNTFEIYLPPLRERREDILPLALYFAGKNSKKHVRFTDKVVHSLNSYDWPGNIRELENTIKRAILIAAGGDTISIEHLSKKLQEIVESIPEKTSDEGVIDQMERMIILQTLEKNSFNRSQTARALKMSRRTLTFKIRRLREAGYEI